jgi:hypothetical protein
MTIQVYRSYRKSTFFLYSEHFVEQLRSIKETQKTLQEPKKLQRVLVWRSCNLSICCESDRNLFWRAACSLCPGLTPSKGRSSWSGCASPIHQIFQQQRPLRALVVALLVKHLHRLFGQKRPGFEGQEYVMHRPREQAQRKWLGDGSELPFSCNLQCI